MSLSVDQANQYQNKWWRLIEPVLLELLTGSDNEFLNEQISSTFWTAMRDLRLGLVLEELAAGYDTFIQDEWHIELPLFLIEENRYFGDVIIDFAGTRTCVRLEHFCFVAKFAAIFYEKYIDQGFKPWAYFVKLDQMCERFGVIGQDSYNKPT